MLAPVLLALPAGAGAQQPGVPSPTAAEASALLEEAVAALDSDKRRRADPTAELRDLAFALPQLQGAERRRARAVLARPPSGDGRDEPLGGEWSAAATETAQAYDTPGGGFRIHWVEAGGDAPDLAPDADADGVPDFVELVAARADASRSVLNDSLGWPEPKSDGEAGGGDGLTDVYLADVCHPSGSDSCVFGYSSVDDKRDDCRRPPFRCAAFLVLDNDYAPNEFPGYPAPDIPLQVTMAHEYNHVLQFGIDSRQDQWMLESTATWAEEQVFPSADDWLDTYMARWARGSGAPITSSEAQQGLRVYGTAVWNHWLERGAGYGPDAVLDSWRSSRASRPRHFAAGAYDLGSRAHGGKGFARDFARFAAATAEWRVADGNFPDEGRLPKVKRRGTLRRDRRAKAFRLDHLAYRLLRVKPRAANTIRLRVRAPRRVRTGVALIGRKGGAASGTITGTRRFLRRGGKRTVRLRNARSFDRITAVVVNADARVRGFDGFDWRYARDNERFRARVLGPRRR